MRVLPVFWEWQLTNKTRVGLSAIAALWANLASGAAAKSRSARIRSAAARAASHSASFAATTSATLSKAATFSISSAASASTTSYAFNKAHLADAVTLSHSATANITHPSAFWSAIRADCIALLAGGDPHLLPLWPAENPLAEQWSTIRTHPSTQSPGWRFWIDWYERALTGQPQDWKLLEKVALIDPKDWDKGTDHVNALILQIIRNHRPPPPKLTPEIRAHLDLVLTLRDPLRQSAQYLKGQFEALEKAYRQQTGHPNETPEELEPIATLARAFGQIAWLLGNETDKDSLIAQLQAEVAILKANNAALIAAAHGPKASAMRDVFVNALGGVTAGLVVAMILANVDFLGGPATADSLEPLSQLLTGPIIDFSPSIPR